MDYCGSAYSSALMRRVQLSTREDRSRRALNLLCNVLDFTDRAVAERMDPPVTYQAIQQRRKGTTRIRLEDRARIAAALGVPETVFDMEPPDILRWLADNARELVISASPCTTASDGLLAACAA